MLGQIHAVMKQADDIDNLSVRQPENHQMGAFLPTELPTPGSLDSAGFCTNALQVLAQALLGFKSFDAPGTAHRLNCGQTQAEADSHLGLQLAGLPGTVPEHRWLQPDCRRFPM